MQPTNPNIGKNTETALDRIRASYLQEDAEERLSADDKQRRAEIEAAHSLLTLYHSTEQAVPLLIGKFGFGRATAYRRISESMRLFGDVTRSYKDGIRHLLYEYTNKVLQLALSAKDKFGKAAPDLKAANTAIKNMALLKGLNKDDTNALTPEVLGNRTFVLQVHVHGQDGTPTAIDLGNLDQVDANTYAQLAQAVEGSDLSLEGMQNLLTKASEGEEEEDES